MGDENEWAKSNLGVSRRELIKRGAIVGGAVVWAAPVVQSFGSPAFAGSAAPGAGKDISFVALLVNCGGTLFRVKFEGAFPTSGPFGPTECGPRFSVPCSTDLSRNATAVAGLPLSQATTCPAVTASFNGATGSLTVNLGTCTLIDYRVKCGTGCTKPGDPGAPVTGGTSATFVKCLGATG